MIAVLFRQISGNFKNFEKSLNCFAAVFCSFLQRILIITKKLNLVTTLHIGKGTNHDITGLVIFSMLPETDRLQEMVL